MSVKWKPDSIEVLRGVRGTTSRKVRFPIAGVKTSELLELVNKSKEDCKPIERKRRGKAIKELDKRRKLYGLSKRKTV